MFSGLRRSGGFIFALLVGLGFDLSDFVGSTLIAYAIWITAGVWAIYTLWPSLKRWRPFTLAPIEGDPRRAESEDVKAEASSVSAWDDPEFKFTVVNKKPFRNETVSLDGFLYTNCTFENVTFVCKGEKPFGLVAFTVLGKDTTIKTEGAPLWAYSRLLNILGYINREVEKGDELRPDAAIARIEGGRVEIFESKEEEDQRIGREREELEAKRNAQLQSRCFYLSERLRQFWEAWEQEEDRQDQDVVGRYNDEFGGEVADVINALKGVGWWNSQEHGHLEFPQSLQDIRLLDYRLRGLGLGQP